MKKILSIIILLSLLVLASRGVLSASDVSLVYHEYSDQYATEQITGETFITIKNISENETIINRQKQFKNCSIIDEFVLDREYSLERWRRICTEEDTDYTSVRSGNILTVTGKIKGEDVNKELDLGAKALHIYPKYSLSKFALSGMPKMKLWSLRRDEMTKLPMQAIRKGVEMITVNGEEVEAIKVYYSITGKFREKHFNHNYYFRKSDGLFLKKEEQNGKVELLVKEG